DDGLYTAENTPLTVPLYIRFADKYAYLTVQDKSALDKDKLLPPDKVLPPDRPAGSGVAAKNVERLPGDKVATVEGPTVVSATIHIDQIPQGLKQAAITQFEQQLAVAKEKKA